MNESYATICFLVFIAVVFLVCLVITLIEGEVNERHEVR
jgi:hypothetical protein